LDFGICSGPILWPLTVPFSVDPLAVESLPVMSVAERFGFRVYTTTLTRDDVGGLRYIYESTNINWEAMSPDSTMFIRTSRPASSCCSLEPDPVRVAGAHQQCRGPGALYPTLSIAATTKSIRKSGYQCNVVSYQLRVGAVWTPPHTVYATNRTLTVQTWYHHIFNNGYVSKVQRPWDAGAAADLFRTRATLDYGPDSY